MLVKLTGTSRFTISAAAMLAAAVLAAGCSPPATPVEDSPRARLLGALPAEQAERGVYIVDLATAGEASPGSRLGPLLEGVIDDADLMVETAAPPVTLLGGVDESVPTPPDAVREGTTLVFAAPDVAAATRQRLRDGELAAGELVELSASSAPVAWRGPTPAPEATGRTTITLSDATVMMRADTSAPGPLAESVREQLQSGGPPGSPGKPWSTLMADPDVVAGPGHVTILATPRDLPGLLLRSLVDQQQLTFLAP